MSSNVLKRFSYIPRIMLVLIVAMTMLVACTAPAATPQPEEQAPAEEQATEVVAPADTAAPAEEEPVAEPAEETEGGVPAGVLLLKEENVMQFVRNFNPFMTMPPSLWPAHATMYEPLLVYSQTTSEFIPWLATEYVWNDDATVLTFTTRENVKWSDGEPFSANDVYYTFDLMQKFPALDTGGVWQYIDSIKLLDDTHVEFTFKSAFVPALLNIGQAPIVAEHIWKDVADPTTFANEEPVATGPLTEITLFQEQVYEVSANPYYWQEGKPMIKGIRVPAMAEDAYFLSLGKGDFDWGSSFVPDIQGTFSDKDPEHFKWWAPAIGNSTFLYLNTTREPFDDVRVRKAFSMALDRGLMVDTALYGYSSPDDASALSARFDSWKDPKIVEEHAGLVTLNIDEANKLLDEAGLVKGANGFRTLPDGSPWKVYADNAGWADYAAISQIVAQNLRQVGVDAEARAFNADAWFDKVFKGDFDMSVGWSATGSTPYETYRGLMSELTFKPIGETSGENWHRYVSAEADVLLAELAATADPVKQQDLVNQLQQLFIDEFPAVPLYSQGNLVQYNTTRFEGFPDPENPYSSPTSYSIPETFLIINNLKPK